MEHLNYQTLISSSSSSSGGSISFGGVSCVDSSISKLLFPFNSLASRADEITSNNELPPLPLAFVEISFKAINWLTAFRLFGSKLSKKNVRLNPRASSITLYTLLLLQYKVVFHFTKSLACNNVMLAPCPVHCCKHHLKLCKGSLMVERQLFA